MKVMTTGEIARLVGASRKQIVRVCKHDLSQSERDKYVSWAGQNRVISAEAVPLFRQKVREREQRTRWNKDVASRR